ncbi:MAG: PilZ domain-containing protein [Pseudomonadota bacterium]|uniref:PilZ domain-containing protein n=1 Tax=Candidatus Desulfatibia profunda TaxID=2841695 RepID=A0A8J6THZ2_9BACT|nr:PilZ domain-containing protein [Candidatus Desulfatibia profunda]MBL7179588.1 PilZ domain-containing protein [Desulfobacterales bacterium]
MESFVEKRKHPRTEVRWPIKVDKHGEIIEGETRNIAADGISICCDEPLPLNEIVSISIEPLGQQPIEVYGKVVWSDVYGIDDKNKTYGIGICFVQISKQDRSRYGDLVSVLMAQ